MDYEELRRALIHESDTKEKPKNFVCKRCGYYPIKEVHDGDECPSCGFKDILPVTSN
jgi:rubrerythrin